MKDPGLTLQKAQESLSGPMQAHLSLETDGLLLEGDLVRSGPGHYTFAVSAPPDLTGVMVSCRDGACTLSMEGLSVPLPKLGDAGFWPVDRFNSALDAVLRREELTFLPAETGGRLEGEGFSFVLDEQGFPLVFALHEPEITLRCTLLQQE